MKMRSKQKTQKSSEINTKNSEKESKVLDINNEQLMAKICEDNQYFSSLIDLIPPKIYFEGNEEILESMESNKKLKFNDESDLTAKARHKRFKLDPNNTQKVSQIAQQFYSNGKQNTVNNKFNKIEELKHKLNEKINKLKSSRGGKSDAKTLRESKRERRKNNSIRASKQKGFVKNNTSDKQSTQESHKTVKNKIKKQKLNDSDSNDINNSNNSNNGLKTDKLPKIYNKDGNLVYSKFDFVSSALESDVKKNKKKRSLDRLLFKAKKEEEKLTQLEATNASAAKHLKQKKLWRNAIEMSEGNKVKDNSKLIEKSLKKIKKKKDKSSKQWKERKESLEQKMNSKQEKRKRNIAHKCKQKKEKKLSKIRKRGRIVNGK